MMSSQIEIKKKIINKSKKPPHKSMQLSQGKRPIKMLDHGQKNENNINLISNNQNNLKNYQKLQEELNMYKNKVQKLEE